MSRHRARAAVFRLALASALLAGAGCADGRSGAGEQVPTVRVAAAANLQFAMAELVDAMAAADPPVRLAVTYGSSGAFYEQIVNGAPFDVFLSADLAYPQALVDAGLADEVFDYAAGRLVLWAPDGSPADVTAGLAGLTDPAVRRIAVANPQHAPYGEAAVAAMTSAGVYEQTRDRLVFGENVAQAAEFAASGNAQVAIVALSLVQAGPLDGQGHYTVVPDGSFPRLDQGGVVLSAAADRPAALAVRDLLTGPQGQAIFEKYGFRAVGD
jgi:molybdate transport system substrate-binding protein